MFALNCNYIAFEILSGKNLGNCYQLDHHDRQAFGH